MAIATNAFEAVGLRSNDATSSAGTDHVMYDAEEQIWDFKSAREKVGTWEKHVVDL
jgi:hypothetical protein